MGRPAEANRFCETGREVDRGFSQAAGSSSSLRLTCAIPCVAASFSVLNCDLVKVTAIELGTVSLRGVLTRRLDWWLSCCGEALKGRR